MLKKKKENTELRKQRKMKPSNSIQLVRGSGALAARTAERRKIAPAGEAA